MTPEETRFIRRRVNDELKAELELRLSLAKIAGAGMR